LYEREPDALGAAARAHVVAHYNWNRVLQGLMVRYQAAAGVRHLPALGGALQNS
jgi:hypothetical protein